MNTNQTAAILSQLYTVWPQTGTDDDAHRELRLWEWAFENDPYEAVNAGIQFWIMGGKPFMPKPSDIRNMIAQRAVQIEPDIEWGRVRKSLRTHGQRREPAPYINPETDQLDSIPPETFHPLVEQVIDALGWKEMALGDTDKVRTSFIFALKNIIKLQQDKIVFGQTDLALPGTSMESLESGDK